MTGGVGYFFDEEGDFCDKVNTEIVVAQRVITNAGAKQLKGLIEVRNTNLSGSNAPSCVLGPPSEPLAT